MKSLRLILGSIAATVIAADEQVVHLHGMNKADNQSSGALMGKPHRDVSSALVATTGSLSIDFGRSPTIRECTSPSRTRTPCPIPMSATKWHASPQARLHGRLFYLPGAAGSEQNREPREPVDLGGSSHCGERQREEGDARSPRQLV
jgi:hypothetical protein